MRVFILCTGRSGSTAIINACKHIKNYTSSHESLTHSFGRDRFRYPENHIEADNRLAWHLGLLNKLYGDDPIYVHLKRDKEKVAQSFLKRFYIPGSIIDSFCEGIRMTPSEKLSKEMRLKACYDYIDTVNANIEHFLAKKSKVITLNLETIRVDFIQFWNYLGAEGNLEKALHEFDKKHNATSQRRLNMAWRMRLIATREWRHIKSYFHSV
ncbi:MAG TPA: hypothetical protein PKY06_22095 [Saprospiraceae bacterium]|nr:hypothetical protein [Saprospiraceae bacterium]